jgi:hypothetical protein
MILAISGQGTHVILFIQSARTSNITGEIFPSSCGERPEWPMNG